MAHRGGGGPAGRSDLAPGGVDGYRLPACSLYFCRVPRTRPHLAALLAAVLTAGLLALVPAPAGAIEDYAPYQPATRCSPTAKPGTVRLARWLVRKYGGGHGPISRRCGGSTSEHTEGRAFDWSLNAARRADRRTAERFLRRIFATDRRGNEHALARRMGIMYVIWNDRI